MSDKFKWKQVQPKYGPTYWVLFVGAIEVGSVVSSLQKGNNDFSIRASDLFSPRIVSTHGYKIREEAMTALETTVESVVDAMGLTWKE